LVFLPSTLSNAFLRGESKNLAQTNAAKTKELHDLLIAWRKEISASMPTRNDGQAPSKKKQKVDP
jgi:arylsulfatase A